MRKLAVFMLLVLGFCWCVSAVELIRVAGELHPSTKDYFALKYENNAIHIDEEKVVIPDINRIYFQSRSDEEDHYHIKPLIDGDEHYSVNNVRVDGFDVYMSYQNRQGNFSLVKYNMRSDTHSDPVERVLSNQRIKIINRGVAVVGTYWSQYGRFLTLYDDESGGEKPQRAEELFDRLYTLTTPYVISYYTNNFIQTDSAHILEMNGERAKAFHSAFFVTPVDVDENNSLYFVDHSNGYEINIYDSAATKQGSIRVENENFIPYPNVENFSTDFNVQNTSTVSALYIVEDMILCSFRKTVTGRDLPRPPYYYDIISVDGEFVSRGTFPFPLLAKDDTGTLFFLYRVDRGWFAEDDLFLVGFTIQEVIGGMVTKEVFEKVVADYDDKRSK